jgi:outer membrane murein-binding lipoprotein Lpp
MVLFAIVLCAGLIAGCATANSIQSARKQLQDADKAGAKWSAPHEYYAAEAYLNAAVHEAEEGSPRADVDRFLSKSLDYSAKALQSTKGGAK